MNDKRIFQLKINGIDQSVNAIKALNKELTLLENRLNRLNKINVNVSPSIQGKDNSKIVRTSKQDDSALAKLTAALDKEKTKQIEMQNEAYREQAALLKQIKEENKQIANGAKDIDGNYTNTLAGMKAKLADMKKELNTMNVDDSGFDGLVSKIRELNDEIKGVEQAYGQFGRNVGNYADFNKMEEDVKAYSNSINELTKRIKDLTSQRNTLDVDSQQFKDVSKEIEDLTKKLKELENAGKDLSDIDMELAFDGKTFSKTTALMGAMQDKLRLLALQGKENTKEYQLLNDQIIRFSDTISTVNRNVEKGKTGMKGMVNMIENVKAITAIGGIGSGLSSMFGGDNNMDGVMTKFAQFSMILQGFGEIQEQINDATTGLGKAFQWLAGIMTVDLADKGGKALEKYTKEIYPFHQAIMQSKKELFQYANTLEELSDKFKNLSVFDRIRVQSRLLTTASLDGLSDEAKDYITTFKEVASTNKKLGDSYNSLREDVRKYRRDHRELAKIAKEEGTSISELFKQAKEGSKSMSFWDKTTAIVSKGMEQLVLVVKKAISTIATFVKAFGPLIIIVGVVLALFKALYEVYTRIWGDKRFENQLQRTNAALDTNNRMLEDNIKYWKRLDDIMNNSPFERADHQVSALTHSLKNVNREMQQFIKDGAGKLGGNWWKQLWRSSEKDMMADTLEKGIKSLNGLSDEDAAKQLKSLLGDRNFSRAFANIDDLGINKDLVERTKRLVSEMEEQYDSLVDANDEKNRLIADGNRRATRNDIEALREGFDKRRALLQQQKKEELEQAEGHEKLRLSILNKYRQQELTLERDIASEIRRINETIQSNRTASMAPGIGRDIQGTRDAEAAEKANARDNYEKGMYESEEQFNKHLNSISAKYARQRSDMYRDRNKAILDDQRAWARLSIQLYIDYADSLRNIARQIEDIKADALTMDIDINAEDAMKGVLYGNPGNLGGSEYDTSNLDKYFKEILRLENEYNDEVINNNLKNANMQYERALEDETKRIADRKKVIQQQLDDEIQSLKDKLKEGVISRAEYNKRVEELTKVSNDTILNEEQLSKEMLIALEEKYQKDVLKVQQDGEKNRLANNKRYYDSLVSNLTEYNSNLLTEFDKAFEPSDRDNPLSQYWNTKSLDEYVNGVKSAIANLEGQKTNIENTMEELRKQFELGEISVEDYKNYKKALEKELTDIKTVTDNKGALINESVKRWVDKAASHIGNYLQTLNGMFNTIMELSSRELQFKKDQLDKEQEIINERMEALREEGDRIKAEYDRQEEIAREHADKINDIEDELKTARGDRRDALIDDLARERAAQESAIKLKEKQQREQEKIEKRKEEQAKKQEELKKKQLEIDRQMKRVQQKQAIAQAIMNTFSGATMALATYPWPFSGVIAGIVTALGLANVAQISSQKFAEGGLLKGRSHSQGGIPVGNTGIEVEGNEYVVNKYSTNHNLSLLEFINSNKKKITLDDIVDFYSDRPIIRNTGYKRVFETGGKLPTMDIDRDKKVTRVINEGDDRPVVVSVVDINNAQDNLREVEVLSGLR